jgi:hypothetical protein
MHMWHHVTNHLITSNDKDSNSENRIKLRVRDREVAEALQSIQLEPSDTRSQSYRLLTKLSSLIY